VSRRLAGLAGGRLWARGYVGHDDLGLLDDLSDGFLE